jgi:hypothetical protein
MFLSSFFSSELNWSERFQFAWQLTWPSLLLGIGWALSAFLLIGRIPTFLQAGYAFFDLLIVSPWLVRRAFRLQFSTYRLETVRNGMPFPIGYTESFKVMWLLAWRSSILFLPTLILIGNLFRIVGINFAEFAPSPETAPLLDQVGLALFEDAGFLLVSPLIVPGMIHKRYRDFIVRATRPGAEPVKSPKPKQTQPARKR